MKSISYLFPNNTPENLYQDWVNFVLYSSNDHKTLKDFKENYLKTELIDTSTICLNLFSDKQLTRMFINFINQNYWNDSFFKGSHLIKNFEKPRTKRKEIKSYFDLFSGIGGGSLALKRVIPTAKCVGCSDKDLNASSVYRYHFPRHLNYGDITKVDIEELPDFDLLIGGSPCQDLSCLKTNREGLKGSRSNLFYKFLEIVKIKKPSFFIFENVASMRNIDKDTISKELGISHTLLNSKLVSAQNRNRYYWIGELINGKYHKVDIDIPEDKGISLEEILEKEADSEVYKYQKELKISKKSRTIELDPDKYIQTFKEVRTEQGKLLRRQHRQLTGIDKTFRGKDLKKYTSNNHQKSNCLTTSVGSPESLVAIKERDNFFKIRPLSVLEFERLQTFPDDYTNLGISNGKVVHPTKTQRYKMLGNSFTVGVIEHILKELTDYEK